MNLSEQPIYPFDLCQPLPEPGHPLLLEASAGTGKTYTLSFMIARFIAEGFPIDSLLSVTFSRRANAELRDGIYARLHDFLRALQADSVDLIEDEAIRRIVSSWPLDSYPELISSFKKAIASIDQAPIYTLHGFAHRMLNELGIMADHDDASEAVEDFSILIDEVIYDLSLDFHRRFPRVDFQLWYEVGRKALFHLNEKTYCVESMAFLDEYVQTLRQEFEKRKRCQRLMSYDDMIVRLVNALNDPQRGKRASEILRNRFPVVMIDEFQDTDPLQWDFIEKAFLSSSVLMMIGDPKQAIYRFRGGDIETYLAVRSRPQITCYSLTHNYRSDEPVVRAIENLFGDSSFTSTSDNIYLPRLQVHHRNSRMRFPSSIAEPVIMRCASGKKLGYQTTKKKIVSDLISYIDQMIDPHSDYEIYEQMGADHRWRMVECRDIAVLVSSNAMGRFIQSQLRAQGYPAIFSGEGSVLDTEAAQQWVTFLEAVLTRSQRAIRRAALTSLMGWTLKDLLDDDSDAIMDLVEQILRCSQLLEQHSASAICDYLANENRLYERLLGSDGGEQMLTDIRHIARLLDEAQLVHQIRGRALLDMLKAAIEHGFLPFSASITRRLSTERSSIQIMTIHQAKGLQFPIVLLPEAPFSSYARKRSAQSSPRIIHRDGQRLLDLYPSHSPQEIVKATVMEEAAESLRAFYVACTRAQSHLVMWWAPMDKTESSPIHRLWFSTGQSGIPPLSLPLPRAAIPPIESISVTAIGEEKSPRYRLDGTDCPDLTVRYFTSHIDRDWTRTSYSGLTRHAHSSSVLIPAMSGIDDEADIDALPIDPGGDETTLPVSSLANCPSGSEFGSLVHLLFEHVDPADPQRRHRLEEQIRLYAPRYAIADLDHSALIDGIDEAMTTPLGDLCDQASLSDLGAQRIICEMDFTMSLGDRNRRHVTDLAMLFSRYCSDHPFLAYGDYLASSEAGTKALAGFLTGSIDALIHLDNPERYVVVDYKTNRFPSPVDPHHVGLYTAETMSQMMIAAHYPLQALIYCAAVHRLLSWRLPHYDPDRHLGGVGYLFVRGMSGPNNPVISSMPTGVMIWRPPADMIVAASKILGGEE